ncbi:MAG: hypothetical protein NDI67_13320 [Sulfuritalea sp.]|nr:hypothetical protein [Sulfuritalea sp.]
MADAKKAMELASAMRTACIKAALDGYEQAQIAGLCQEGAWECAVDAMRKLDLETLLRSQVPAGGGDAGE